MSIVGNKVKGIRAALCQDTESAIMTRRHNDSNIVVLAAEHNSIDSALSIITAFFSTPFDGGRHLRRVRKITD